VHSDGAICFTDPHYGINTDYEGGKHPPELPPCVYRLLLTGCTVANLVFGGRNRSRLFLCAGDALKSIYPNVRGAQRP
jgi:sugar lactone lactonase YvrE